VHHLAPDGGKNALKSDEEHDVLNVCEQELYNCGNYLDGPPKIPVNGICLHTEDAC
jgi:hypothetical protein